MDWWPFRSKAANTSPTLDAALLMGGGTGQPEWPADNYDHYAREGYGRSELVYACINEIAASSAEGRLRAVTTGDDDIDELTRGPLADLLAQPSERDEQFELIEAINVCLDIAGNCYVFKERGRAGQVTGLYLLRPDRVKIVPGPKLATGYIYTVDGAEYFVAGEDVGHIKLPNPFDDWYGLSPLHVLAKMVNLDSSLTDFTKTFFQNAGVPSGLLKIQRALRDQDEAEAIRTRWRTQFQGVRNWHRIAVLDENAEYQPMAGSMKDMDLTPLRDIPETRICSVFAVPPILVGARVGLTTATYSNYEQARRAFWEETLLPRNKRIRAGLMRTLRPEFVELTSRAVRLDWDYRDVRALQDNQTEKSARIVAEWRAGLLLRDEARAALGYDPAPAGEGEVFASVAAGEPPAGQPAAAPPPPAVEAGRRTRALASPDPAGDGDTRAAMIRTLDTFGLRMLNRADGILGRARDMPVRATGRDSANGSADAGALVPPAADGELAALWAPLLHAATADAATQAGREPDPAAVLELCRAATLRILELNDQAWNAVEFAIQNAALDGETVGTLAPRVRAILTETYRTNAPDIVMRELGAIADAVRALPDIPAADRRNGHSLSEVLA